MKYDISEFIKRSEFIDCTEKDGLLLWNYNHKCQYAGAWDEFTCAARGLVTKPDGTVVARPFKKFFNYGERDVELPNEKPIITEKMDGSLFIIARYGDRLITCTRGSFDSEQAQWARQWLEDREIGIEYFKEGYTYLCEIICNWNRIVVDYKGQEGIFFISIVDNETGKDVENTFSGNAFTVKKSDLTFEQIQERCKTMKGTEEEGYVLYYPSTGLRIKMKGEDYVRIHRLISNLSTKSIWENLMNGVSVEDTLKDIPDEFYNWVKKTVGDFNDKYNEIYGQALLLHVTLEKTLGERKLIAQFLQEKYPNKLSIVMSLIDGKDVSKLIWRQLRPEYSKPLINE